MTDNQELIRQHGVNLLRNVPEVRTFPDLVRAAESNPELARQLREWAENKLAQAKSTKDAPLW